MMEKQKEVIPIKRLIEDTEHDIKRHQEVTRKLPTDSRVPNPFTDQGNSKKSDSKKK